MINKFKVAFYGIYCALKHRSVLVQCILALFALAFAWILNFSVMEFMVVIGCIVMVIVSEMFNTCIELLCDMYTKEFNPMIKLIKDISAGAVLVSAIGSLVIGVFLVINHL